MGIIIENILAVLPEGADDVIRETTLYIEEDKITGIGDKPAGFTADKVIDGTDKLVIPGLVNCHTHSYMSFMRNVADDQRHHLFQRYADEHSPDHPCGEGVGYARRDLPRPCGKRQ